MNASNITSKHITGLNLTTPKQVSSTESHGEKTKPYVKAHISNQTNALKQELNNWIDGIYNPTHFLTLQLPDNLRRANKMNSITHLRRIMLEFERALLGRHWNKKHLPFICFEEKCVLYGWHFHILLNQREFTVQQLQAAIISVSDKFNFPTYCLDLRPISFNDTQNVAGYSEKQIVIKELGRFDSDRIILSHNLFYLPYKDPHLSSKQN